MTGKAKGFQFRAAAGSKRAELHILSRIGPSFWDDSGITPATLKADLEALGNFDALDVYINSPGGSVFDGIAIYNMLREHEAQVTVHVIGLAASIASVIAMAADPGQLFMADNAIMMIHDPMTWTDGNAKDHRATAEVLDTIKKAIAVAYEQRSGMKPKDIADMMSAETWMTAEDARAKGFADAVTKATAEAEDIANFDLAGYRFAAQHVKPKNRTAPADPGNQNHEEEPMDPTIAAAQAAEKIEAARREGEASALANEQKRRTDVRAMFEPFANREDVTKLRDEVLDDTKITAEDASKRLLEALGKTHTPTTGTKKIEIARDERDKIVEGTSIAILAMHGAGDPKADLKGNEFMGMSLGSLLRASCVRAGHPEFARLEKNALAEKFFALGMIGTTDFPLSLAAVANKQLRKFYDAIPQTWKEWAAQGSVSDFKSISMIALGTFPDLLTIDEGGEYKAGAFGEEAETGKIGTKGRQLILSRQAIINDDLGIFVRKAAMMGAAAARTVNNDAYAALVANANTADGGAFFNATAETTVGGHANLTSSGTVISAASLGVGAVAMAKHKDKDGNSVLYIRPKKLLVPVGLEQTAYLLLNSPYDPAATNPNTPNAARRYALELVSDPYLDAASATAWYLLADPSVAPAFEVFFLDGNDTPYTDEAVDWDTDALKYKIRLDYGVAPVEWRSGYKNVGA